MVPANQRVGAGHEKKSVHASRTSARTGVRIGNSKTEPFVLSVVQERSAIFLMIAEGTE
jgi:hypothetical protein